eukprot:756096_1
MAASVLKDSTISLLKIDDKGWNIGLFINNNQTYECKECHNICCDAVELSCDHDDDEIDLYCEVCLNEAISSNNNACPINKTHNPSIQSNRSIRRQIMKLQVHCPESIEYQNRNNADPNNIICDTSDAKEGDYYKQNNNDTRCHWSGTLNELISDHITKCEAAALDLNQKTIEHMEQTLNTLALKMQKETKELRNVIEKQQEKTQQIEENLKSTDDQINQLQNTVQELQKHLKLKDDQINNMETQIQNIAAKLIVSEETKQNDQIQKGKGFFDIYDNQRIKVTNNGTLFTCIKGCYYTPIASTNSFNTGVHQWRIKYVQNVNDKGCNGCFHPGIFSDIDQVFQMNGSVYYTDQMKFTRYAYVLSGSQIVCYGSQKTEGSGSCNQWNVSQGEIIDIILDCNNWTLGMTGNNQPLNNQYKLKIAPNQSYHPCFVTCGCRRQFELMSIHITEVRLFSVSHF